MLFHVFHVFVLFFFCVQEHNIPNWLRQGLSIPLFGDTSPVTGSKHLPHTVLNNFVWNILQITPETTQETFKPISSLLLPSNCKIILLADVDGDGMLELVTGHADRAVYIHKLHVVKEHHKQSDVCDQPSTGVIQNRILRVLVT